MIKGKKRTSEKSISSGVPKAKVLKLTTTKVDSSKFKSKIEDKVEENSKEELTKSNKNKFQKKAAEVTEKTDWRKFKQEKKDLKLNRKKGKDTYEVVAQLKKMYEKLKCRKTENKVELVDKMYALCDGFIPKMVMAHDSARIVQCMLKCASPTTREKISEALLTLAANIATLKYSNFCILRMFKYGSPTIKNKLVDSFFGNIVKLASHNISSKFLDLAYLTVATAKQKAHMRQEFYGDLYKKTKDNNVKCLSDTYKDSPHMKAAILGSVKSNLEHVANKKLVDSSLIHAVILEYIQECDENNIEETITTFSSMIPMLITTKDGCQAAIICFQKSAQKNRRAIIKAIKEHLVKICTHEQGYIFLLAVLNALDDTKAIKKAIFDTLHPHLETLADNQWGRRVIEWFISPGTTKCFHPEFIASMEENLKYGKKDKDIRRKEILEQIEGPIADAIAENPKFWISNRHIGLMTAAILNTINSENFVKAATGIATVICDPSWEVIQIEDKEKDSETKENTSGKKKKEKEISSVNGESKPIAGIEDTGLHIALKRIIKHDIERRKISPDIQTFGTILLQQLTDETLQHWVTVNRSCFILLIVIENNPEEMKTLKKLIKPHLKTLQTTKGAGAKLLLQKFELK